MQDWHTNMGSSCLMCSGWMDRGTGVLTFEQKEQLTDESKDELGINIYEKAIYS